MPPKPRGRPPKKHHNITGLQNSSSLSTLCQFQQFPKAVIINEEDDILIVSSQEAD
jgi:hypothetical protein